MTSSKKIQFVSALVLTLGLNAACGNGHEGDSSDISAVSSELPACQLTTDCSQALPQLAKAKGFSGFYKKLITKGKPLHRGRDIIVVPGAPVWIQAKFTYGILDADLHKEVIDIYLSQGCYSGFQKIGQALTSNDDEHEAVEGVADSGGRIYVNLATFGIKSLPIGRHRVVLVVPGDNTMTELYITVVDPKQKIVVSDIDGTLTESELAAAVDVFGGSAKAHPGAAETLQVLHSKGYEILYLTARMEWLGADTRKWLLAHHFPIGTIRTTNSKIGATGTAASAFKLAQLEMLTDLTGIVPSIAIGNKITDVAAYNAAGISGDGSYYFGLNADLAGGSEFSNYTFLAESFQASAKVCQ